MAPRLAPPFRPAGEADAPILAVLMNEATYGLALHGWARAAGPDADPWAFGAQRQAEHAREGRWTVADEGAGVLAGLQVWAPGTSAPSIPPSPTARPQLALRALRPEALYVNVLATLPTARRRGYGTGLMRLAEAMAAEVDAPALTLIVNDANDTARRLYDGLGYRTVATRPIVKDTWDGPGTTWLLMCKER